MLIAQVSETYTAVQSTARASLLFHRSRFITRCEASTALWFLLWIFRWRKIGSSCGMGCDVESHNNADLMDADQNHPQVTASEGKDPFASTGSSFVGTAVSSCVR